MFFAAKYIVYEIVNKFVKLSKTHFASQWEYWGNELILFE